MLPTIIAALSALILLCVPLSTPQSRELHSIRWTPLTLNPLGGGSSAATSARPGTPRAQALASERGAAQSSQESISLEPGKPFERELSGGQSHSYRITMISGQYLQIVVEQRGIDVAVVMFAPDGKKISEADSEHSIEGSEIVSAITEAPGTYLIEARSLEKTAKTGRYEIKVGELRAATAAEKYRVAGEVTFREAERLQNGNLEDRRKSVEKYHEALELYRRAGHRNGEATAFHNIGVVYNSLGEMQKALEKHNEALPIFRAIGDRVGEAIALDNIGMVYDSLGDMRKSLETRTEALPIFRALGDRKEEAIALNNIGMVYRSLGEPQKALETYNEAMLLRQAVGDRGGV